MTGRAPWLPPRVQPVAGRRLTAADLRDLLALADLQRRRHVRALHDTWGIAAGLQVDHERRRDFFVRPGVAYDHCGRLVVVGASVALTGSDDLTASRVVVIRADREAREPAATLALVEPADVRLGLDVPLGLLVPGETVADPAVRRFVRTGARVVLAGGVVRHGTAVATGNARAWSAWIDTRHAALPARPVYVAGLPARVAVPGTVTATVQITDSTGNGFRVHVRRVAPNLPSTSAVALTTNPEDVSWLAALPQEAAGVADPPPPAGPCAGVSFTEEDV